jgi:hypothetical protein
VGARHRHVINVTCCVPCAVAPADGIEAEEDDDAEPPPDKREWTSFVAEHPELAPEPLTFTDDERVAALVEAERQERETDRPWEKTAKDRASRLAYLKRHPGVGSSSVADVLAGRPHIATFNASSTSSWDTGLSGSRVRGAIMPLRALSRRSHLERRTGAHTGAH